MSGKKPSPPPSGIDFLETGHDDRYMKQVFEQVDKVPDKEPAEKLPTRGKIKSQQQRDSPFAALSGSGGSLSGCAARDRGARATWLSIPRNQHSSGLAGRWKASPATSYAEFSEWTNVF